jgi:uncharacterized protein YuzE
MWSACVAPIQIVYVAKIDALYARFDDQKQGAITERLSEDMVLDIGKGDKIVGIEILDASKRLNLESPLPVRDGVVA